MWDAKNKKAERSFSADLAEGAPYGHQYLDCKGYAGPYKPAGNNGGKGCTAITTRTTRRSCSS